MDLQVYKDLRLLKVIAVVLPIAVVIVISFFAFQVQYAKSIANPVLELLKNKQVSVELCGKPIYKISDLNDAFENIFTSKVAGSKPISLKVLSVATNETSYVVQIGMDSINNNMFWVYSERGPLNNIVAGFIESTYIREQYDTCE